MLATPDGLIAIVEELDAHGSAGLDEDIHEFFGLTGLVRKPLPAQAVAITGSAKYLRDTKATRSVLHSTDSDVNS